MRHLVCAAFTLLPSIATAAETTNYAYDAKGRLTKVVHTGGRNDGMASTYQFDAADNRTSNQVTGARGRLIVVPLGGLRPIPTG